MPSPAAEPAVAPLAEVIAKPPRGSGRGGSLLVVLAGVVAVGGLAFAAGRLTAPASTVAGFRGGQLPGGQVRGAQLPGDGQGFPGRGGAFGGMSISGKVTAVTPDSITVELASGSSLTIPVDEETTYRTASPATVDAVGVGSEVAVTPGARTVDPGASLDPNAQPGLGGGISFGAASDVTVIEP